MLLEGTGRRRESTGIRADASTSEKRKELKLQAEEVYHARMVQLARGRVGLPIDTGETFAQFSEWYETHHTAKHRSAARERVILAGLRGHFGSLTLAEIRPARWTEYETTRLADGVTLSTIGRELAVMKTILGAAVGEHLDVSPLAHVKRKTITLPPKRTLTLADERKLLKAITDDEIRDLYLVGVGTLLRQMNLINLQRREHDRTRLLVQTKTGPHQVPLNGPTMLQERAALVLKRRMPKTKDGYFFPKWQKRFDGKRDSGNAWFLKIVRRAVLRAGIRWGLKDHGVVWHTMTRASGATRMMNEHGQSIRTVQVIGNWRSLDQMAAYLGVDVAAVSGVSAPVRRVNVG
jgi:hypothetical protein